MSFWVKRIGSRGILLSECVPENIYTFYCKLSHIGGSAARFGNHKADKRTFPFIDDVFLFVPGWISWPLKAARIRRREYGLDGLVHVSIATARE
jgi:hypothetical protein